MTGQLQSLPFWFSNISTNSWPFRNPCKFEVLKGGIPVGTKNFFFPGIHFHSGALRIHEHFSIIKWTIEENYKTDLSWKIYWRELPAFAFLKLINLFFSVFDSSAKIPESIEKGNTIFMGHFDECIDIDGPNKTFTGQHCMLDMFVYINNFKVILFVSQKLWKAFRWQCLISSFNKTSRAVWSQIYQLFRRDV